MKRNLAAAGAVIAAMMFGGHAQAAQQQAAAPEQAPQRQLTISKEERAALAPVQKAIDAQDWAGAAAALPAAQAAVSGADAKYVLAGMQLKIAIGTKNVPGQMAGIDALIASGGVPAASLPGLYRNLAGLAADTKNQPREEAAYQRLLELNPTDAEASILLAQIKGKQGKTQEALRLAGSAIEATRASGQPVKENWYRYALKLAYEAKLGPQSLKTSQDLLAAYPTAENWRTMLLVYRDLSNLDKEGRRDLLRLMHASKALTGDKDWYDLAEGLDVDGLPGEAKAVLDEGGRLKAIDLGSSAFAPVLSAATKKYGEHRASLAESEAKAKTSTTGALALRIGEVAYGFGEYAKAAALFRTAISKGSVDTNMANTRLGMALALAGQKAEAEAAFKAVQGPRAELAGYWLMWLKRA